MADSYKDIIITPYRSNTADPKIEFRGANSSTNTTISMITYPTSNGTISFEGSAGQLFSITNDLSGSLFSVNDVSGIPSLEVFANGQVNITQYGGNVGIGVATPAYKLDVRGGNGVISNFVGTGSTYQGIAIQNNYGSGSVYSAAFVDVRNENSVLVSGLRSDIYADGSTGWAWNVTRAGARTSDRRYDALVLESSSKVIMGPYAGNSTSGGIVGLEIKNNGGTGDSNLAAVALHCTGQYATHMHLRADGFFGMGGWSASAWRWYVNMPNGDLTTAGNITAYSDPRLKEDIKPINSALDKIKALRGVRFRWKDNSILGHPGEYDYGVLADNVQEILPEIVTDSMHEAPEGDRYKTVAYDKLAPVLIEAVKEQQLTIDQQAAKIEDLEQKLNTLIQMLQDK